MLSSPPGRRGSKGRPSSTTTIRSSPPKGRVSRASASSAAPSDIPSKLPHPAKAGGPGSKSSAGASQSASDTPRQPFEDQLRQIPPSGQPESAETRDELELKPPEQNDGVDAEIQISPLPKDEKSQSQGDKLDTTPSKLSTREGNRFFRFIDRTSIIGGCCGLKSRRGQGVWMESFQHVKFSIPVMMLLILSFGHALGCAVSNLWYSGNLVVAGKHRFSRISGTEVCMCTDIVACPILDADCVSYQEAYGKLPGGVALMWASLGTVMFYSGCTVLLLVRVHGDVFSPLMQISVCAVLLPVAISMPGVSLMERWAAENFAEGVYTRGHAIYIFISAVVCCLLAFVILLYTSCLVGRRHAPATPSNIVFLEGGKEVEVLPIHGVVELCIEGLIMTIRRNVFGRQPKAGGALSSHKGIKAERLADSNVAGTSDGAADVAVASPKSAWGIHRLRGFTWRLLHTRQITLPANRTSRTATDAETKNTTS